jgi:hypothetical protein
MFGNASNSLDIYVGNLANTAKSSQILFSRAFFNSKFSQITAETIKQFSGNSNTQSYNLNLKEW